MDVILYPKHPTNEEGMSAVFPTDCANPSRGRLGHDEAGRGSEVGWLVVSWGRLTGRSWGAGSLRDARLPVTRHVPTTVGPVTPIVTAAHSGFAPNWSTLRSMDQDLLRCATEP